MIAHGTEGFIYDDRKIGMLPLLQIKALIAEMEKSNSKKWNDSPAVKLHSCNTGKGDDS
jgi:hypothetical protein